MPPSVWLACMVRLKFRMQSGLTCNGVYSALCQKTWPVIKYITHTVFSRGAISTLVSVTPTVAFVAINTLIQWLLKFTSYAFRLIFHSDILVYLTQINLVVGSLHIENCKTVTRWINGWMSNTYIFAIVVSCNLWDGQKRLVFSFLSSIFFTHLMARHAQYISTY